MSDGPLVIDALGLKCPEPVMMLHAAVRKTAPGGHIKLLATDPSTKRDVASFCRFLGHEVLQEEEVDGEFHYLIAKAG